MNNLSLLDLFYKNVENNGDKCAVICGDNKISYMELDQLSSSLAEALSKYVKKGDFIALYTEKSIEMIVAIFASLKLGTIYVPIDIRYPEERIKYIIKDSGSKIILTYKTHLNIDGVKCYGLENLAISDKKSIYSGNPENIDYCIYTSGTTGKPKGVLIKDKSVVNLVESYYDLYGIVEEDILLQFASIAFDQSVWDIFTILTRGGTLCVLPQELIGDIKGAEEYIIKNKVSVAAFTPAYLRELNPEVVVTLRAVESGGAAVERDVVKKWKKHCRVFNTYGPTEACVNALTYELQEEIPSVIPIGKPIKNMQAYIINKDKECKIGEVGELCLAGIGLSVGYLNNEDLTKEKFIDNPFGTGKLYRTGDLAKKQEDGNIVCVGRCDNQLKIRGFRIDTGEMETVMNSYGQAAIGIEENQLGSKIIIGYIKSNMDYNLLIKKMQSFLPDYMIPTKIIYIEEMPLTVNGKVDYKKLHDIYLKSIANIECVKPVTEFQKKATKIFGDVLNIQTYGTNFNFIENGGNSINAIRITSLLNEAGYNVSVGNVISTTNIIQLEKLIIQKQELEKKDITSGIKIKEKIEETIGNKIKNFSKLTPTQMYMYKAYKEKIVGDNFLQYLYKINCDYDFNKIVETANLLPIQYDSLTSNFIEVENEVYQITFENKLIEVIEISVKDMNEVYEYMKNDVIKGFDFANESLMRFCVFIFPNGIKKLLCSVYHIIVDGWSMDNILKTFNRNYIQLLHGASREELIEVIKALNIPSITKYNNIINNASYDEALQYWNQYYKDSENAITTISHDNNILCKEYNNIIDYISDEDSIKIRNFCRELKITENSLFELAFAYLNSKEDIEKRKDILFTKVISGRDVPIDNISNMVGTMINIIPQRVKISNDYIKELNEISKNNLVNMAYDKMDFYRTKVGNNYLMERISTMIVFCNYYDSTIYDFEYELDKDQDDIDLSLYIDALSTNYRLYLTCKKSAYTEKRAKYLLNRFRSIVMEIINECSSFNR